jgi:hypothetical protein
MAMREVSVVPVNDRTRDVKSVIKRVAQSWCHGNAFRTPPLPNNHGVIENKVEAPNTYADADSFHTPARTPQLVHNVLLLMS